MKDEKEQSVELKKKHEIDMTNGLLAVHILLFSLR